MVSVGCCLFVRSSIQCYRFCPCGLTLAVPAACRMEWVEIIRRQAWKNAGFASLRDVREHIEETEPRFDPTVYPLPNADYQIPKDNYDNADDHDVQKVHDRRPGRSSVTAYRSLYMSGELTPLDVVQAILPFIQRDSSPPGEHSMAWFDVKVEQILEAAKSSTLRYKAGRSLGPLDGIPTAVKDEYDIEGYMTSLGSANDYTGQEFDNTGITSWCVVKLKEAGAIIMGKTSMHEFGLGNSSLDPENSYTVSLHSQIRLATISPTELPETHTIGTITPVVVLLGRLTPLHQVWFQLHWAATGVAASAYLLPFAQSLASNQPTAGYHPSQAKTTVIHAVSMGR